MDTWVSFPQVKPQGREANQSSPASAEADKTWIISSISPYIVMA
jgi:hypothetical protein